MKALNAISNNKNALWRNNSALDSLKLTISGYPEPHSHLSRLIFSVCITFDIRAITCHHLSNDYPVSLASPVSFATLRVEFYSNSNNFIEIPFASLQFVGNRT